MAGGYNITAVKAVDEMNNKIDEQRRFLKWTGANWAELPQSSNADGSIE